MPGIIHIDGAALEHLRPHK